MKPSLALAITQNALVDLVPKTDWLMSQKLDGKRCCVEVTDGDVTVWSRNGTTTTFPTRIRDALKSSLAKGHFMIDGELLNAGDEKEQKFFAFDMPVAGNLIGLDTPFKDRLAALEQLSTLCGWPESKVLATLSYASTTDEKSRLIRRLYSNRAEGVIARHVNGVYKSGRRCDTLLKAKFVKDADVVVLAKNTAGKDNITVGVYKDGRMVEVGRCTALVGDGPACNVGEVVQLDYLYLGPHGRLVQPTNPRLRIDKSPQECDWDQLVPTDKAVLS
jgi:ATP-dependent DNA ligase